MEFTKEQGTKNSHENKPGIHKKTILKLGGEQGSKNSRENKPKIHKKTRL